MKYLSPSSLSKFYEDAREFFTKYVVTGLPRIPQTQAMSIGSAFDCYVKSAVSGEAFADLFMNSVEEHNRDYAVAAGRDVWTRFKSSGAWDALCRRINSGRVKVDWGYEARVVDGVDIPLMGLPDIVIYPVQEGENKLVVDWKVNGYLSKSGVSPVAGYVNKYGGRKDGEPHKDAVCSFRGNTFFNIDNNIKRLKKDWYRQLLTYDMISSEQSEEQSVLGIDQLCFRGGELVVAEHRVVADSGDIEMLKAEYNYLAGLVRGYEEGTDTWFFKDLSREENDTLISLCKKNAELYLGGGEVADMLRLLRS